MSQASTLHENHAFAERLRQSLKGIGVRPSATVLANEFNLRYWGKSITITTARNWLHGKSIPTQDKLRVLAEWLHVSADELRFGSLTPVIKFQNSSLDTSTLTMQDRDMLTKYIVLSVADRKIVCDVVHALAVAASVNER